MENSRKIELLAPAKNEEVAIEAIKCGADAIYIGADKFGARSSAGNTIESIERVVNYAHQFNAKVYVTVNTIIKDSEIKDVENLIKELYDIKVDALIVQDMGILNMNIPPIQLHASTQCDIRTVEKAQFLQNAGFSQLVLARELNVKEISAIKEAVNVPLEAFIHGALCVSYSGRCHVSEALKGRSANRGECAQICRLPYDLIDGDGNVIKVGKHLLSLKDLNQSMVLEDMLSAGVSSFKIEGRLKDISYVKNVVSKYSQILNEIVSKSGGRYERSSSGTSYPGFTPILNKSFNRSFTNYFLLNRSSLSSKIASFDTPKSMGEPIGTVIKASGKSIKIDSRIELNNGDGISYVDSFGQYSGFRVNKIVGNVINTLNPVSISSGTKLYRTFDKAFEDVIDSVKSRRLLKLNLKITNENGLLRLYANDELGNNVSVDIQCDIVEAQKSQHDSQVRTLSKLGDTNFEIGTIETIDDIFIPASILAQCKRTIVEKLNKLQLSNYKRPLRGEMKNEFNYPVSTLSYADNVSNSLAESFYRNHGVKQIESALEITHDKNVINEMPLMTTRYCLRRELGFCKKTNMGKNLKEPLKLKSNNIVLRVEFDCVNCEMKVYRHSQH